MTALERARQARSHLEVAELALDAVEEALRAGDLDLAEAEARVAVRNMGEAQTLVESVELDELAPYDRTRVEL